jgi:hypothetical protein
MERRAFSRALRVEIGADAMERLRTQLATHDRRGLPEGAPDPT